MKNYYKTSVSLLVIISLVAGLISFAWPIPTTEAAVLMSETFRNDYTPEGDWISGGSGEGWQACLTAASEDAPNSIPACSSEPEDYLEDGALRLTDNENDRSGFAIYNTPISAEDGLKIEFDMFQYGGDGADGISFFLVDGAVSPTQPGASGGSLGYSGSGGENPGIEGGYVGVGFDRYGNFSSVGAGVGGTGALSNSIALRGSEDSDYRFITKTAADGLLSGTDRYDSIRPVRIIISTNNIMSVYVDYGSGYVSELTNIDLNDINGEESFPEFFKFGFAASTGGSTNTHEIRNLVVSTNPPNVSIDAQYAPSYVQGQTASFIATVANSASAEETVGAITVTNTMPAGLTPTSANGQDWDCGVAGQTVTCESDDVLAAGETSEAITINFNVAANATASLSNTLTVAVAENVNTSPSTTDLLTILSADYLDNDGVTNAEEEGAPNDGDVNNDGTPDSEQVFVTSLLNPITNSYATLEAEGCVEGNSNVSIMDAGDGVSADGDYSYPVGLMNFTLECEGPGDEATVTQYYFTDLDPSEVELRKYSDTDEAFTAIDEAVIEAVEIDNEPVLKISYSIIDGGELDEDGLENGVIVDPSGPAVLTAVNEPQVSPTPTSVGPQADESADGSLPGTGIPAQTKPVDARLRIAGGLLLGIGGLGVLLLIKRRRQVRL